MSLVLKRYVFVAVTGLKKMGSLYTSHMSLVLKRQGLVFVDVSGLKKTRSWSL